MVVKRRNDQGIIGIYKTLVINFNKGLDCV